MKRLRKSSSPQVKLATPSGTVHTEPAGWVAEVPFGFLATYKLVAGKSYYGESTGSRSSTDGWLEIPPSPMLTEDVFERHVPGFKFKQIYRDNRPSNVKVPDSQAFKMTAFYGTRKVTVRGRILYDLNPNYDPHASQKGPICMSCTGAMCDECAKYQSRLEPSNKPPKHSSTY